MINLRYSKLPLAGKILLPMLSVFLGMWVAGTVLVGYAKTREDTKALKRETQVAAVQISKEIENAQEILSFKTKSIVEIDAVIEAIDAEEEQKLLQVVLPLRFSFDMDLIKIVDRKGKLLSNLRSSVVDAADLQDGDAIAMAEKGLVVTTLLAPKEAPPLLIKTLSIDSRRETIGSILVGYALTPEVLTEMRGARRQHIILLKDLDVIATTLSGDHHSHEAISTAVDWSAQSSDIQQISIANAAYLSQTIPLPQIADGQIKAVVLTPLNEFQASQRQMWLIVGSFGSVGALAMVAIGLGITKLITRRITNLTAATQLLASGDLTVRLPISGNDEVAMLATGFNDMAEQLKHRDAKIKHQVEELKNLVQKLQQMPQQVHMEKMAGLGQMVAGVAHEINNPVGFIYSNVAPAKAYVQDLFGLIELYKQHFPDPPEEIKEEEDLIDLDFVKTDLPNVLDSMKSGAERIREIVLSLRNFSRKDESEMKAVNINDGLDSTLVILGHRVKAKADFPAIEIVKDYSVLPPVYCFAREINQVFLNVIGNAIDAIKSSMAQQRKENKNKAITFSPQIRIQTDTVDSDCVIIRISNTGSFIPQAIRDKVFDPFFTTKAVGAGAGIGLSISYQIVTEKHGGKIWCDSDPELGTEFVIQLPIAMRPDDAVAISKLSVGKNY